MIKKKRKKDGRKPEIVFGLTGLPYAGKGVAADYLTKKHNFFYSSLSDRIREEIRKRGQTITRDSLQAIGGELRRKYGGSVLAKRTWEKTSESSFQKVVIDAIRAREEVVFLKTKKRFYLIGVSASSKTRFKRMVGKGRESDDPKRWNDFLKMEKRDNRSEGRDIHGCLKMADFTLENNGSKKELYLKIEIFLGRVFK